MKFYEGRNLIAEKFFDVLGHKQFGVIHLLLQRQWMETLESFTRYVDRVVKEFYANLTDEHQDESSFMFEKVYVCGLWCSFTSKDVADALALPYSVEVPNMPFDRAVIFR